MILIILFILFTFLDLSSLYLNRLQKQLFYRKKYKKYQQTISLKIQQSQNNHLLFKAFVNIVKKQISSLYNILLNLIMIQHRKSINIPQNYRLIVCLAISLIIVITLLLNAFWMDTLYKEGVNIIYSAQTNLDWVVLKIVNNLFSMLCHPSTVGIIILAELCLVKHKLKSIIHVSFFLLCIYWIAFLKQAYQQSRPIWSSKLIHKWQWFCPTDFGNPSGHSFALFPLYEPLISKYIGFQNFRSGWVLLIVFGFLVPFSRTYLGVHSVNQVMFGLTLGLAATVLYRYILRQWNYIIFAKILKLKKLKYLVIAICIHILCIVLPFIFFQIYSENRPMQKNDVQNLNQFCFQSLTSYLIQQSMLVKCTMESFIFGVIYGLYFLKVTKKDKQYFTGRWEYASYTAISLHFLSTILIIVIIAGLFIVLLPHLIKITFLNYLSNTIGMILVGFCLIYVLPKIERKFQWIKYWDENLLGQGQEMKQNNQLCQCFE